MALLNSLEKIGGFIVQNLIKVNLYTETYKVLDDNGNPFFLKVFDINKLPLKLVNKDSGIVYEIEYCRNIKHKNIVSVITDGIFEKEDNVYQYYVTNYFNGRVLSDLISTEGKLEEREALKIFRGILDGLLYLHSENVVLCHNDLDVSNIILSDIQNRIPVIIDLGHLAKPCNGFGNWFDTSDINPLYHANETMVGVFDEQGDIFSVCAILYTMLTGKAPWNIDVQSQGSYKDRFKEVWAYRRKNDLDLDDLVVTNKTKYILSKGLAAKSQSRFLSILEIINILDSEDESVLDNKNAEKVQSAFSQAKKNESDDVSGDGINRIDIEIKKGGGNGFNDIAGMQSLKDYLQQKVIFVIKNKDIAEEYKLLPPNGLLLYGPPGCGKTFFAEKFAEETGFNYMLVKSSDVGSSYHHGTQEKIRRLFKLAQKNSPIVLCFDEFDALVPDRNTTREAFASQEVNEFLSQMNNCAKRGIFIIATSNRPDKIDPAVLRTGRIDKQVYVPLPDFDARKEMFKMYLSNRPVEGEMKYDLFSESTDGYIASDIAFIVNDSAMTAAYARRLITNDLIMMTINNIKPSLSKDAIAQYGDVQQKMECISRRVIVESL